MKMNSRMVFWVVTWFLLAVGVLAYDPPVDTAGPLTVRIRQVGAGLYGQGGLAELLPEAPCPFSVALQNAGETPVVGMLRVEVIDRWRVEPSGTVPFSVNAKGMTQLRFVVTAGEGTYNAHYPIHAYAEFEYQGRRYVAHPILIVETRFPNPPRSPLPFEWRPVSVLGNGAMGLWRVPVHREQTSAVSRTPWGTMEAALDAPKQRTLGTTGREAYPATASVQFGARVQRGESRECVSMGIGPRPPSFRERVIVARVEYPLELPKTQPIRFRFGAAVDDHTRGSVMFRVRVASFDAPQEQEGAIVLERRVATKAWQNEEADLSRYTGQKIRLQLDALGPPDGADASEAYWAEPTLVTGNPPAPSVFPPRPGADSRLLGTVESDGTSYQVRLWPGQRGVLDAAVGFLNGNARLLFHGFQLRVLGDQLEDWRSSSELVEAREEPAGNGRYRVRHRFRNWVGNFDVLSELWTEKGALWTRFWMENVPPPRPWLNVHLEDVAAGPWSELAKRVYVGPGNVLEQPDAFRLQFGGHYMATSFVGLDFADGISMVQGVDVVPTNLDVDPALHLYTIRTAHTPTLAFIPSREVWNAVKVWRDVNGLKAAGGVAKLAGRFVFDLWGGGGGRYAVGAASLARAFRYGLTDSMVVWHTWQRWGYDYRLPDLYPPNPQLGTLEEFRSLVNVCKENGVLFAPHDNYTDFYANADGFTYANIAFLQDGSPQRAWLNSGREAQSYRPRADRILPFVERNVRLVKEGFAPTAYFIDVLTSTNPHDYWTEEGQFIDRLTTRKSWGEAGAWIRDFLGDNGPLISEAGHDQLIGWLDGSQAQVLRVEAPPAEGFLWPIKSADAERTPWYDAAHHDRYILHGAGYPDRYAAGLDSRLHGIYSDDYIATEVLTGHPAMVADAFGRDVVRKYWLLHDLMRGLALRRIEGVRFGGNLHQQEVRWDNGADVWVNRDSGGWTVAGHTLPQYGYYVSMPQKGGALESAIERRDGVIVEWSRSSALLYVNARPLVFDPLPQRGRSASEAGPDPRSARMNPEKKAISFGAVTTDGACRFTPEQDGLRVTPLPNSPAFRVRLRWKDLPWPLREPQVTEALDESGKVIRQSPVQKAGDEILLNCEPDVFAYRVR